MKKTITVVLLGLTATLLSNCNKILPSEPESNTVLAEPISSLNSTQLALHIEGDEEFARIFSEKEGLGPIFVQNSCESCHAGDGKGNPFNNLTRFGNYNALNIWDPQLSQGGPQLQHRSISHHEPEQLPSGVETSDFIAPNVTGLGYLGAVEDATILSMVDSNDSDGDGISGTVNYISAPSWLPIDNRYQQQQANGKYIGRFGRKASAINLLNQTVGAYKQDMGITSDFDLNDPVNYFSSGLSDDNVADPEIPASTVNKVVFYLQTLEAPRRRNETDANVIAGSLLFTQIGCEGCHKSKLTTGQSEIDALDQVDFYPYTDMLMHDMGGDLDDSYTEGTAKTYEWRTVPLWGLGLQNESQGGQMFLMHDGRATTYEEAISFHKGEANQSRTNYNALTGAEKDQLVQFLNSL